MMSLKGLFKGFVGMVSATSVALSMQGKAMAYNPASHLQENAAKSEYALFQTCKVAGLKLDHQRFGIRKRLDVIEGLENRVNELHAINKDLARPRSDVPPGDYAPHRIPINKALIQRLESEKLFQTGQVRQAYRQYGTQRAVVDNACSRF
jgi:hypothetical protein